MKSASVIATMALLTAGSASAEFAKVTDAEKFKQIVAGKTLTRPLVELEVSPTGSIRGMGVTWEVTGDWQWQDGYFCRSLNWGGSDLGYNCQEVAVRENRIRFTSDRGRGNSADFRLR